MSQEQKIQKFFRTYFTEIKIKQDYAQKVLKQAEQYQTKNRCKQFLARFFDALKKSFDGKNPKHFVTSVKRFLYIINKLLGESYKKENSGRYCELISSQIVPYYLFFFEIIFKHSLHELIVELKMQRMKWVKLITDGAFIKLRQGLYSMKRQQILSKHKFNLDRGFSQENLDKIKKIHQKRGLTEKQSNFYLGIENKEENRTENAHKTPQKSSQNSSDESDNEYQSSGKKRKYDTNFMNDQNLPNSYYPSYDPNTVYNPNVYQNQYERPNTPQMLDPRFKRNIYNDQSPYVMNSAGRNFYAQEKPPNNFATLTNVGPSNYASSLNSTPMTTYFPPPPIQKPQSYETPSYPRPSEFKELKEPNGFNFNRYKIQKIRKELQKSLFKCKQCGLCFETGENHEKHTNQHFFERLQKETELELKTKTKKQSKLKLLDIKSWQSGDRSVEKMYRFEVLMSELSEEKPTGHNCFFCNEQLEISFSEKYEDWVFSDSIKINDQGKTSIMHFDCYECFKSDQNSPIST